MVPFSQGLPIRANALPLAPNCPTPGSKNPRRAYMPRSFPAPSCRHGPPPVATRPAPRSFEGLPNDRAPTGQRPTPRSARRSGHEIPYGPKASPRSAGSHAITLHARLPTRLDGPLRSRSQGPTDPVPPRRPPHAVPVARFVVGDMGWRRHRATSKRRRQRNLPPRRTTRSDACGTGGNTPRSRSRRRRFACRQRRSYPMLGAPTA